MPFIDTIWLPPSELSGGDILKAPSGSLFMEFDGGQFLRGHRPGGPGGTPINVSVNLSTFAGKMLAEDDDIDRKGVVIRSLQFVVDPQSACAPKSAEIGDLLSNGEVHAVVASSPTGDPIRVVLGTALSDAPLICYRSWRINTAGVGIFVRFDIG